MSRPPHQMGALEASACLEAGTLSAEALAESCLDRIADRDPVVAAWEHLDREAVLAEARALDRQPRRESLHGLPVAVKDIIDVAGMPTRMGSPIYAATTAAPADAACVALMKAAGAYAMGKTVTTEFANFHPGKTRNPHGAEHTPGGSSSGSAAAVADCMVPLAIGTQTAGSVIRPAAFCGVVGYKPSFGLIPRAGIKPLADSLDTVGVFARSVADAALLASALAGLPNFRLPAGPGDQAPRIGLCRTPEWSHADSDARAAFEAAGRMAERKGAQVRDVDLPAAFQDLAQAQSIIQSFETTRSLAWERHVHGALLSDRLRDQLNGASAITLEAYTAAVDVVRRCRGLLDEIMAEVDVLIAPSAAGAAPHGHDSTGDPIFNRVWTALHSPAINLPVPTASLGGDAALPLGVTVTGIPGQDAEILASAHWLFSTLSP